MWASGPDTLRSLFAHLLNIIGLWLLHDAVLPYFCCVTHPRATPPKLTYSLSLSLCLILSWQTDCHGFQPTHSCSSAVMRVPIQKAFILLVTGQRTRWQTGELYKDNVGQTCVCVFVRLCLHLPELSEEGFCKMSTMTGGLGKNISSYKISTKQCSHPKKFSARSLFEKNSFSLHISWFSARK